MFTMLFGLLIVAAGAVVFGLALFGRRPVPQPAMAGVGRPRDARTPEADPRNSRVPSQATDQLVEDRSPAERRDEEISGDEITGVVRRRRTEDVALSPMVRLRSALLLTLTVVGIAMLSGAVLSVIAVGAILILT